MPAPPPRAWACWPSCSRARRSRRDACSWPRDSPRHLRLLNVAQLSTLSRHGQVGQQLGEQRMRQRVSTPHSLMCPCSSRCHCSTPFDWHTHEATRAVSANRAEPSALSTYVALATHDFQIHRRATHGVGHEMARFAVGVDQASCAVHPRQVRTAVRVRRLTTAAPSKIVEL